MKDTWKVLVVEDVYDDIQVISKVLRHHGAQVFIANSGTDCLTMVGEVQPTVIVMDLAIPGKDGWETLSDLRTNPETADIPVVAVTAYHSVNVAEDAIKAGFNGYFPKPVNPHSFVERLEQLLE